jgi:hypothetical protein
VVVGVISPLSAGEITVHKDCVTTDETIADHITIEQPSQEELQGVTHTVSLTQSRQAARLHNSLGLSRAYAPQFYGHRIPPPSSKVPPYNGVIFCFLTSLYIDPHLIVTQWKHRLQNNQ